MKLELGWNKEKILMQTVSRTRTLKTGVLGKVQMPLKGCNDSDG